MIKGLLRIFAGFGITSLLLAPLADKAIRNATREMNEELEKVISLKKTS